MGRRKRIWNGFQASGLSDLGKGFATSQKTRFIGYGREGEEFGSGQIESETPVDHTGIFNQ